MRVRVIEDHPDIALYVHDLLSRSGADLEVETVTEGFAELGGWNEIDVAVVDLMLGQEARGVDILCALRDQYPHVRRVIFSAVSELSPEVQAIAHATVGKPGSSEELLAAVRGR